MRTFIKNIIIFVIIAIFFNIYFSTIVKDNYFKKYSKDLHKKSSSTILLACSHGNSLTEYIEGIDIYGITNYSYPSDSYTDMYRKLSHLIKRNKIDTLIITAEDHTLSSYRQVLNNHDRSRDLSDKINFLSPTFFERNLILPNSKAHDFLKLYIKSQISWFFSSNEILFHKKWSEYDKEYKQKKSQDRFVAQYVDKSYSMELENSLLKIIEICKNNNIHLIGIKFPLSKEMVHVMKQSSLNFDKDSFYKNNRHIYDDTSLKVDSIFNANSIDIFNFKNLFINKEHLFQNQDHLNALGAEKFNTILHEKFNDLSNSNL
tara:strand:+ start:887 stop:1837 length:951 start_codon:yes stop_codon:yes gene_type:complete